MPEESKIPGSGLFEQAGKTLGELKEKAEDVVGDVMSDLKEGGEKLIDSAENMIGEDNIKKAQDFLGTDVKKITADLMDKASDLAESVGDKVEDLLDKKKD